MIKRTVYTGMNIMSWDVEYIYPKNTEMTYKYFENYIKNLAMDISSSNPDILVIQNISNGINGLKILISVIEKIYNIKYLIYNADEMGEEGSVYVISKVKILNTYRLGKNIHFSFFYNNNSYHIYGVYLYKKIDYTIKNSNQYNIDILSDFYKIYKDSLKYKNKKVCILGNFNSYYGSKALRTIHTLGFVNLNYTQKSKKYMYNKYTRNYDNKLEKTFELEHAYVNKKMFGGIKHFIISEKLNQNINFTGNRLIHFQINIIL